MTTPDPRTGHALVEGQVVEFSPTLHFNVVQTNAFDRWGVGERVSNTWNTLDGMGPVFPAGLLFNDAARLLGFSIRNRLFAGEYNRMLWRLDRPAGRRAPTISTAVQPWQERLRYAYVNVEGIGEFNLGDAITSVRSHRIDLDLPSDWAAGWRLASERGQRVNISVEVRPPSFLSTAIRDRLLTARGRELINPRYGSELRRYIGPNRESDTDVIAGVQFALADLVQRGYISTPIVSVVPSNVGGLNISVTVPQLDAPVTMELN